MAETPTIHASAVLVGAHAVLIRGAAGSGKSSLALALIQAAPAGELRFARLVADDRCHVEARGGRLLVRPAAELAGLIEVRGLGIRALPYEPVAVVGLIVDLATAEDRLPDIAAQTAQIDGIRLPRIGIAPANAALRTVLAAIQTPAARI